MPINLPTNLLRSFVAIVEAGSMLSATEQVFVTQSALSVQIRKLEELVQQTLFTREGRRLALTPAGTVLLDYSRRILALHDEALARLSAGQITGPIRIGMVQDFADALFAGVLARFAELHPESTIYARVAGTAELQTMLEKNQLDLYVGFADASHPAAQTRAPMGWYGESGLDALDIVPLAVLEKPCRFREAAITSLERAGRRYRIAVETPNLSTLRAAVQARLGVTCRTHLFRPDISVIAAGSLPPLPDVACILSVAEGAGEAPRYLATLVERAIGALEAQTAEQEL